MKFIIKNPKENIASLTRRIGYRYLGKNAETEEMSFIRPLERGGYPRFHLYIKVEGENLIFNLHLDQRKPVYNSVTAHSADYHGEPVQKEAQRIKQILQSI